jgi:hypothetical protein
LPWGDLAVLTCAGGLSWLTGLEIFARRNICTL